MLLQQALLFSAGIRLTRRPELTAESTKCAVSLARLSKDLNNSFTLFKKLKGRANL
jgi:hypothetical protein